MQETDVFINCPFSPDYNEHFWAIIFTVVRSGLDPRCAREADDAGENRFGKICRIISECRYGINDISNTRLDDATGLPRFNMPLELGLFLGARKFGGRKQADRETLILDIDPHRYLAFISDIRGQDINAYEGDPTSLIIRVASWLRDTAAHAHIPGGRAIAAEFSVFRQDLPNLCMQEHLELDEITFLDFKRFAAAWIAGEDLI
jgi:hypothetical protein